MALDNISIRPFLPEEWLDFKAKRLQALKELPHLFLSSYDDAASKPDDFWRDLLVGEKEKIFGLYDNSKLIGITGVFDTGTTQTAKPRIWG